MPWFALLAGLLLEEALGVTDAEAGPGAAVNIDTTARRRAVLHTAVLAPTLGMVACAVFPKIAEYRDAQAKRSPTLPICAYVSRHSNHDERIYAWGFAPDIYTYCKRAPASRYVFSTFQSGFVPFDDAPHAVDRTRVVPGSPEIFLSELESSRAALVIDVPFTMGNRSIDETPAYAAYFAKHYCPPVVYDGVRSEPNGRAKGRQERP